MLMLSISKIYISLFSALAVTVLVDLTARMARRTADLKGCSTAMWHPTDETRHGIILLR